MTDARADLGVVDPVAGRRRLVVTTSFPRHPGDSAGNFVAARVQALVAAGERVQVIAAGEPSPHEPPGVAVQRIPFALPGVPPLFYAGGAPERLERSPLPAVLQAARFWDGLLPAIRAALPHVEVVESHWLLPSALAVRLCCGPRRTSPTPTRATSPCWNGCPGAGRWRAGCFARRRRSCWPARTCEPAWAGWPAGSAAPPTGRCARRRAPC